jgi:hypothetical protein
MNGAIPPLPTHIFMMWCLVKHNDNFTFTLLFSFHFHFYRGWPLGLCTSYIRHCVKLSVPSIAVVNVYLFHPLPLPSDCASWFTECNILWLEPKPLILHTVQLHFFYLMTTIKPTFLKMVFARTHNRLRFTLILHHGCLSEQLHLGVILEWLYYSMETHTISSKEHDFKFLR